MNLLISENHALKDESWKMTLKAIIQNTKFTEKITQMPF
jgi:hypothetical protein